MPDLKLHVLGPPRMEIGGIPLAIDRHKAVALLVYLVVTRSSHTRQSLAALFWPEYDQGKAYAYLRRTLWALNRALGNDLLDTGREAVSLASGASIWLDVEQFQQRLHRCRNHDHDAAKGCPDCIPLLTEAAGLYQGDFLAGFSLRDSPAFDEWQYFQAESLRRDLAGALDRLSGCLVAQGDFEAALNAAHRRLALDLLDEAAHRQLMRIHALAGQRSAALRQYQECARLLQTELDLEPGEETQALYEQIRAGGLVPVAAVKSTEAVASTSSPFVDVPLSPSQEPSPGAAALQHNLPLQPTPFVGRSQELAEITALLQNPNCRLLTLVGPGGIGKTRLAIETAARFHAALLESSPDMDGKFTRGVFFVPLTPLSTDEYLVHTIAEVLKLSFRTEEEPEAQLFDYLREKSMLLVLDNFEHLISSAGLLAHILAGAPAVKLLVTSRERLNLQEEWAFQVQGMHFPQEGSSTPPEDYSAVKLFIQNARRVKVDFSASPEDIRSIVRICQMVDGVPLGIELSAAWVKMLSCAEIVHEIEHSLDFLSASLRGLPERHQSLRAVFEHSWTLLGDEEKAAFRKLSVFRGEFQREAAQAVVGGLSASHASHQALALLSALVDKSMLRRNPSGRYEMHELLKQYALEKLRQSPQEEELAHDRHGAFYSAFLEQMDHELRGPRQLEALSWIEDEIEDLRLAWQWAVSHLKITEMRQAAGALALFYDIRSRAEEGEEVFRLAEARLRPVRAELESAGASTAEMDALFAFVLRELAAFTGSRGNFHDAFQLFQESLSIVQQLGAQPGGALAERAVLNMLLGFGAGALEEPEVQRRYRESLEYFRQQGSQWEIAMSHLILGDFTAYQLRDLSQARQLRLKSLMIFEDIGNRWGIALCLNDLSNMSYGLGEYEEARRFSLRSLELCKEIGDNWRTMSCLLNLGQVETALGEYSRAKEAYLESLELARESGNRSMIAVTLDCLGYLNLLMGEISQAEQNYRQSLFLNRANQDQRGEAMALMNLGDLAAASGDDLHACQHYQDSLALLENSEMPWGVAMSLKKLGMAQARLGDHAQAWKSYRDALQMTISIDRFPEMLDVLIGVAELYAGEGRIEQAAELLVLCTRHPAVAREARERAEVLLSELEAELPADRFAVARERGLAAELVSTASRTLAEISI